MDYKQFMILLERGGLSGKENINSLQDFVNEFPYFQSAHALLAKAMHEQQHVRYDRQLKIAAAYAGDRKLLYKLIHPKNERLLSDREIIMDSPFISFPKDELKENENVFIDTKSVSLIPPAEDENSSVETPLKEVTNDTSRVFFSDEYESSESEVDEEEPLVADPHDIIRRRLVEILGLKEEKTGEPVKEIEQEKSIEIIKETKVEQRKAESIVEENKEIPNLQDSNKDIIEHIADESTKAVDFIAKAELEYALEATLIQSLEKLPVIEKPLKKEEYKISREEKTEFSFYDWLKTKSGSEYGKIEEVHAEEILATNQKIENKVIQEESISTSTVIEEKMQDETTQLIDRFIQTDPRIVPSKTEFYSPANQAKKSVTEDEDLVSETLAKIYHQQGNFLKARSSYQKLSLLFPEKLTYFAALISEIDQAINNLNKQDL